VLTTDQKGGIAELAIALAAARLGIDVYHPLQEGGRYDLILDLGDELARVQCKWAARNGDVVVVRCYSSRRNRDGLLRRNYADGEIDAFAVYCAEIDRCFLVPYEEFGRRTQIDLRLNRTKNNQAIGVNWADEFDFVARLGAKLGAVAQLGERVHGMHEVTGSSPVGSTPWGTSSRPRRRRSLRKRPRRSHRDG
jgi:PD-(D/E)XK endonuclease